mgnify:CR=1 FL=1
MKLILASASPRRRELLKILGLDFEVIPSQVEEKITAKEPTLIVTSLAEQKARDVAKRVKEGLVIGADTIVTLEGTILGKPKSKEEAAKMLSMLSGKEHHVITGVALIDVTSQKSLVDYELTKVFFRDLTAEEIESYVRTNEGFDKAGAYAIQGIGSLLVKGIEGCYFNVVGLPLTKIYLLLKNFGIDIL